MDELAADVIEKLSQCLYVFDWLVVNFDSIAKFFLPICGKSPEETDASTN